MNALSLLGLLSRFVGMLTDSRSFLSYPRHEYFRRTLCNLLGRDVETEKFLNAKWRAYNRWWKTSATTMPRISSSSKHLRHI